MCSKVLLVHTGASTMIQWPLLIWFQMDMVLLLILFKSNTLYIGDLHHSVNFANYSTFLLKTLKYKVKKVKKGPCALRASQVNVNLFCQRHTIVFCI